MRFGFYTTMEGLPWGGSEELWSQAASILQRRGHSIHVSYRKWDHVPSPLRRLQENGAVIHWRRRRALYGRSVRRLLMRLRLEHTPHISWLSAAKPDFVVVNAGYHLNDLTVGHACQKAGIPYAILVQAAGYPSWIHNSVVDLFRKSYLGANMCFFVSESNREIVETNLAVNLDNAQIVDNPSNIMVDSPMPWPESELCRIACVGRYHFQSKGQDILVNVLRYQKWRERPLAVHLFGEDDGNERQLRDLIALNNLQDKMILEGFSDNIADVWARHQALILPSRYEGSSLAVVEALRCGRIPIVTEVGRNRELVVDGETGFIAAAAVPSLVDDALERAWAKRHQWREMGLKAKQRLQLNYSANPPHDFAIALEQVAKRDRKFQPFLDAA